MAQCTGDRSHDEDGDDGDASSEAGGYTSGWSSECDDLESARVDIPDPDPAMASTSQSIFQFNLEDGEGKSILFLALTLL